MQPEDPVASAHPAQEGGINGVLEHGVHAVGKLVQVLLVSAILLQVSCLASLLRQSNRERASMRTFHIIT